MTAPLFDDDGTSRPPGPEAEELNRLRLSRDAALDAAREAVRDATRLTRLLTILNESGPLTSLLDRVLSTLSELFAAEVVVLLDPAGTGSYEPLASVGLPEEAVPRPFCDDPDGNVARTMREDGALLLRDAAADATIEAQLAELEVGTVLYVPVTASHSPRGVLILARCRAEPFDFSDVGLITAMAYRIGLAVEQAQRRAQLERIVHSERAIGLDLEEIGVAERTIETFPDLVGADRAMLVMVDETGRILHRVGTPIPEDLDLSALVRRLLATKEIARFEVHDEVSAPLHDRADRCVGALLVAPIGRDRIEGLLCAFRATPTPFDPDLRPIAMLYAGQASAALENARLYRAIRNELGDREKAERALKASEARLAALIRSVHDLIVVFRPEGEIRYVNPAAARFWGTAGDAPVPADFWSRVASADRAALCEVVDELEGAPGTTRVASTGLVEIEGVRQDFDVVLTNLLDEPAIGGIVATFHDMTERRSYERVLENLAFRDPLTGLANRAHFQDRLHFAVSSTEGDGRPVAVIFFDLDDFKIVNDRLGHDAGDRVLVAVAERMRAILRQDDVGARLGGDEFTVLVENDPREATARRIAARLLDAIRRPIPVGEEEVTVGASFGIALGRAGRETAAELLRRADVAMYGAKARGKNACEVWSAALEAPVREGQRPLGLAAPTRSRSRAS